MRKPYCFALLLFFCLAAIAQKNTTKISTATRFDNYIQHALPLWKTPGLSVVVVKDNEVVFKKGYGVRELGKPDSFSTSTIAICASTTKAMTAVCMGILVDEGKVKWTDKLSDVYPELKMYDQYVNSELIIKDLFTHNAGLGNADLLWAFNYSTDSIIQKVRYMPPAYTYHSSFVYQNIMYIIAGEVIHKLSGKPWQQFITERLFQPLGMTNTYASYELSATNTNRITPHFMYPDSVVKTIPYISYKAVGPAGGVWSCADDINKWARFILDSTRINGKQLLKPQTYSLLFKPASIVTESEFYPTAKLTKPHWTTYGLGWFQEDYQGKAVQFHTGSLEGAVAILGLIPDDHFGIYIFANLDHTELRHALMYKAMDLWVFNNDSRDWSTDFYNLYTGLAEEGKKAEKAAEARRVLQTKPSLRLAEYAGKYNHDIYGNADIVLQGDSLVAKFPGNINVFLSHWNYDTFQGKFEREWNGKDLLPFNLNNSGKVKSFEFFGVTWARKE
jgi:CubicO group peptidase (beta-lactamase class C family)